MVAVRDEENITVPPTDVETLDDVKRMHWKRRMFWARPAPNIHACLAFMMGVEPRTLPAAITSKAMITSDGFVMASGVKPSGESFSGGFIGSARDVRDEIAKWANQSHLNDEDKAELSAMLNDWIGEGLNYGNYTFKV